MERVLLEKIPKLTTTNFFEWESNIKLYFRSIGALNIVQGIELIPPTAYADIENQSISFNNYAAPGDETTPFPTYQVPGNREAQVKWGEKDEKAQLALLFTVDDGTKLQIESMASSIAMWSYIQSIWKRAEPIDRATVQAELTTFFLKDGQDPREHVNKYYSILRKAKSVGLMIGEEESCLHFLASLGNDYLTFKEVWTLTPPPQQTLVELIKRFTLRLDQVDKANERNNNQTAMYGFQKKGNAKGGGSGSFSVELEYKCYNCNQYATHRASSCPNEKNTDPNKIKLPSSRPKGSASSGNKGGKNAKKKDDKKKDNKDKEPPTNPNPTASFAAKAILPEFALKSTQSSTLFLVDSGASVHTISDPSLLINVKEHHDLPMIEGITEKTQVKLIGDYRVIIDDCIITLTQVHYVPGSRLNLLSQGRMEDAGWEVNRTKEGGTLNIKDRLNLPLIKDGVLRYLRLGDGRGSESSVVMPGVVKDDLRTWHERLGHMGVSTIKRYIKDGILDLSIEKSDNFTTKDCDVCNEYKMIKQPFNDDVYKAEGALDLIHIDAAGPFEASKMGMKYYMVFKDDKTKFVKLYFMSNKSEALTCLTMFVNWVERAFDRKVKKIRTDGAAEYHSKAWSAYLARTGITHVTTEPYTPEHNGVVERENRTIKEMIVAMMGNGGIGMEYWTYAAHYTTIILNFTRYYEQVKTSPSLPTPHQLYGRSSRFILKAHQFGANVWYKIPPETRKKSDFTLPKALKGKFLGLSVTGPGYLLLNEKGEVVFNKHVVFNEKDLNQGEKEDVGDTDEARRLAEKDDVYEDDASEPTSNNPSSTTNNLPFGPEIPYEGFPRELSPPPFSPVIPPTSPNESVPEIAGLAENSRISMESLAFSAYKAIKHQHGPEPRSYKEAMDREDAALWKPAFLKELGSMEENKVWREVILPKEAKVLSTKWVLKEKKDSEGAITSRKARLVGRGYTQQPGIHYEETFSPVGRITSLRACLILAAEFDWEAQQMDVETAFLNGKLKEEIYISFPDGYTPKDPNSSGLRLDRTLYGLKQSGREWWIEIGDFMVNELGMKRSNSDWGVYVRNDSDKEGCDESDKLFVFVYVDDFVIVGKKNLVAWMKKKLQKKWKMKDLGDVEWVVGIKIERNRSEKTVKFTQSAYIDDVIKRFNLEDSKPTSTPLDTNVKLLKRTDDQPSSSGDYPSLVGSLMWAAICTRPDIMHAVSSLARFNSDPTEEHWNAGVRVIRYLKGTKEMGLTSSKIPNGKSGLMGFVDADYAGDVNDRKSTTGYAFFFNGSLISYASVKQATVAQSTTGAEYMALAAGTNEATYLRALFSEFGIDVGTVRIFGDNQGSIALSKNSVYFKRSKHIDIRYHVIREKVDKGEIKLEYVGTADQTADVLTKGLIKGVHEKHRRGLGVN